MRTGCECERLETGRDEARAVLGPPTRRAKPPRLCVCVRSGGTGTLANVEEATREATRGAGAKALCLLFTVPPFAHTRTRCSTRRALWQYKGTQRAHTWDTYAPRVLVFDIPQPLAPQFPARSRGVERSWQRTSTRYTGHCLTNAHSQLYPRLPRVWSGLARRSLAHTHTTHTHTTHTSHTHNRSSVS